MNESIHAIYFPATIKGAKQDSVILWLSVALAHYPLDLFKATAPVTDPVDTNYFRPFVIFYLDVMWFTLRCIFAIIFCTNRL